MRKDKRNVIASGAKQTSKATRWIASGFALAMTVALAMTFAACTHDDDALDPALSGEAVSFTAGIENTSLRGAAGDKATRTAAGGDTWLTSDKIGIIMLTTGGSLPADIVPDGNNVEYNPASAGKTTNLTAADAPIYWPETGSYDFVAYYPRLDVGGTGDIDGADYTYPIDVADQSDAARLDILYARTDGKTLGDEVSFAFAHSLTKLRVNIDAGGADATFAATLTEMPTTARLALADGSLTGEGAIAPITMHPVTPGDGYAATFEAILIPQAASGYPGRLLMLTLDGGDTYAWDIPDADALPQGKVRTYNLTVAAGVLSLTSSGIDDWTTRDNGTGQLYVPGYLNSAGALRKFAAEWNACYVSGNNIATCNNQYAVLQKWTDDAAKPGNNPPTGTVRLLADIDLTGTGDFPPIGSKDNPFCATFDGGGHTITGLTVASSTNAGLFGYVGDNTSYPGMVRNLTLAGVSVTNTATYTGAVAGYNMVGSTIENVQVSGAVSGVNSTGGIVGCNLATVTGCSFSGTVDGTQYVGGIVGQNIGSYSGGFVTGCSLAVGSKVTGTSGYVGGIVGYNQGGAVIAACSVGSGVEVSGTSNAGGIAGRNNSSGNSGGEITGCWSAAAKVSVTGSYAGGIVGYNSDAATVVGYSFWLNLATGGDQPDTAHGGGNGTTGCASFISRSGLNNQVTDMNAAISTYGWQWVPGANTTTDWPTAEKL